MVVDALSHFCYGEEVTPQRPESSVTNVTKCHKMSHFLSRKQHGMLKMFKKVEKC